MDGAVEKVHPLPSFSNVYLEWAKANTAALLFTLYVAELKPGSWE